MVVQFLWHEDVNPDVPRATTGGDFIFPTMYKHREFLPPRLHSQASHFADDTFSHPGKAELRQSPVAALAVSGVRGGWTGALPPSLPGRSTRDHVLSPLPQSWLQAHGKTLVLHFPMGGNYIYYKYLCFLPVCFTKMVQT